MKLQINRQSDKLLLIVALTALNFFSFSTFALPLKTPVYVKSIDGFTPENKISNTPLNSFEEKLKKSLYLHIVKNLGTDCDFICYEHWSIVRSNQAPDYNYDYGRARLRDIAFSNAGSNVLELSFFNDYNKTFFGYSVSNEITPRFKINIMFSNHESARIFLEKVLSGNVSAVILNKRVLKDEPILLGLFEDYNYHGAILQLKK